MLSTTFVHVGRYADDEHLETKGLSVWIRSLMTFILDRSKSDPTTGDLQSSEVFTLSSCLPKNWFESTAIGL